MLREAEQDGRPLRLPTGYTLDSSRVNYELARKLYRNTADGYKLGAFAAKPIVNAIAGFMGAPHFLSDDKDAQEALDKFFGGNTGRLLRVNRNAARDGDVFVRLEMKQDRFDDRSKPTLAMRVIPPEWCSPIHDTLSGELSEFRIKWPVIDSYRDPITGEVKERGRYYIIETITADERTLRLDGTAPPGTQELLTAREEAEARANNWGFVPIVHFRNEPEENQVYGSSELEPVEPFMKAYNDVLLYAIEGAKLFARPKAKFKLKEVKTFLANNFTEDEIKRGRLPFQNKEVFFMADGDDAEFITADSGLAGTTLLLEFLFYCIVDVSQTPEFAFGTAVASSKASVSEQMPVLARNIRRKRGEYADPYTELGSMWLAMASVIGEITRPETYHVEIDWEEVTPKDDAAVAQQISTIVSAMREAVDGGLISLDAAVEFLQEFVPSMLPWVTEDQADDERTRIIRSRQFLQRLEAGNPNPENPNPQNRPELEVVDGGEG